MIVGAAFLIGGVAALIEAHSHRPIPLGNPFGGGSGDGSFGFSGWSQTAYDLVRIGGFALLIIGAILVIVGLIAYSAGQRRSA
jgi:hypothetical protein